MNIERARSISLLFASSPLDLSPEQFESSLDDWDIETVLSADGQIGLMFISHGPEFHFQKFDIGIQATRAHLRKYPGDLIAKYGHALTKTPHEDTRQQRFNERLGFYKVGKDEFFIHYRIDQLRKKESPCQL